MRFAHIADTHIRNLKYHKEYRIVFERLYENLRQQKVDYIIHCGDLAHTKTQISPEFVEMCSDFLNNLANIAPTYVLLGNHDGNLRATGRQDALSPIVKALGNPNLHLLKKSKTIKLDEVHHLHPLSIFDKGAWPIPSKSPDDINIALYHGSISNCKTDIGWTMEHGENDISIFDDFDYAFLGDIHKTNQIMDKDGKVRYCGSTIQQNHGETNDKGYLLWDISGKDDFTVEHIVLENPKPFITIRLTPSGRLPRKIDVPQGARLRLVTENNLPLDVIRKTVDIARHKYKPETISFLNRSEGMPGSVDNISNFFAKENLRDPGIQNKLIKEYLKDYQLDQDTFETVLELNKKYNLKIEAEEDISRNINWKLKKYEWDNLFNYADGNTLDFSNLHGIVGILGKNFSGKSSVIDGLLYTIFNTTSKNNRRNLNLINQNKEDCRGYVEIAIGPKVYKIERNSEKYKKRLKGKETSEAKTDVNFTVYDTATGEERELNGLSRGDTDKNIRKVFGSIEDFLMTSMSSQLGSLSFINEGSVKRKEILAKFLDLQFFERKFKKAKDDSVDCRSSLKRYDNRDFDKESKKARTELARNEILVSKKEDECKELIEYIKDDEVKLLEVQNHIKSIPTKVIDISSILKQISDKRIELESTKKETKSFRQFLKEKKEIREKIKSFIETFDVESLEEKLELIQEYQKEIIQLKKDIEVHELKLQHQNNKIKLLDEVPCGEEYSHCKFIKDAYAAKNNIDNTIVSIGDLRLNKEVTEEKTDELDHRKTEEHIDNYNKLLVKKNEVSNEINNLELEIQKNNMRIMKLKSKVASLEDAKEEYEENSRAIDNLEKFLGDKSKLTRKIEAQKQQYDICQQQIMDLYKINGSLEQKLENIRESRKEYLSLEKQHAAYDLFMKCMHANGIAYDIIKRRLPIINDEIAKILTNIVDFSILFENDDQKLNILIKHPKYDPRPIELGSGAEKTIAAMAIRLALLNVSTLPKSDVFVLDEPGTALDEENMEGFIRILDMIKTQFKTVLLISHLDSLKDIVDHQIDINITDGYASIEQ